MEQGLNPFVRKPSEERGDKVTRKMKFITAWLLGNIGFQLALLFTVFFVKGFSVVVEGTLEQKPYLLYMMELLFLGVGYFIVSRHGTNEDWKKFMIGYTASFIGTQLVFGVMSVLYSVRISDEVAAFYPYILALVFGVFTVKIVRSDRAHRYTVFAIGGILTLLLYDGIIKFWPSELESFLQFIIFLPIIFIWIPYLPKEEQNKKDAA